MANQGTVSVQNAQIVVSDGAGTAFNTRAIPITSLLLDSTYRHDLQFVAAAAGTAVSLPTTNCYFLYVRNLNGGGGSNVTVNMTPRGQANVITEVLGPGDFILKVWTNNALATVGFTAVTLTSSAGNSNCEVLVAG